MQTKQAYFLGFRLGLRRAGLSKSAADEVSEEFARQTGEEIGIDWDGSKFPVEQLRQGIGVEMEHGSRMGENTNLINDDKSKAARIAWAHLKEIPNYYTLLKQMEDAAKSGEKKADEETGPFKPVDKNQVRAWLQSLGTSPEDMQVHDYAEEQGYNVHQLESAIYELATAEAKS